MLCTCFSKLCTLNTSAFFASPSLSPTRAFSTVLFPAPWGPKTPTTSKSVLSVRKEERLSDTWWESSTNLQARS